MAIEFKDNLNGIAVGLDGLALKTQDAGDTWAVCTTGTQEHIFGILWDKGKWVSVGTNGTIGFADSGGESWQFAKLSEIERAWHMTLVRVSSGYVIIGGTQGMWSDGNWSYLGS